MLIPQLYSDQLLGAACHTFNILSQYGNVTIWCILLLTVTHMMGVLHLKTSDATNVKIHLSLFSLF